MISINKLEHTVMIFEFRFLVLSTVVFSWIRSSFTAQIVETGDLGTFGSNYLNCLFVHCVQIIQMNTRRFEFITYAKILCNILHKLLSKLINFESTISNSIKSAKKIKIILCFLLSSNSYTLISMINQN